MPTVEIDGDGHTVKVSSADALDYVARQAKEIWTETKAERPRLTMGFGSALVERGGSPNVKGDPMHQYGGPAQA